MSKRILFQGDSITDAGRTKDDFYHLGVGYANMVKVSMNTDYPNEYEFINRGVAGNSIVDLYARVKVDFINLKPDYASIFIGVNDTWHELENNNGVDTDRFENIYTMLIEDVKAACPETKLMIISPYVLEGSGTCNTEEEPDRLDRFRKDLAEKAAVAKRIAEKYNLPLLELQPAMDEACTKAPASHWVYDGVHPTAFGHELLKRLWIKTFKEME